MDGPNQRTLTKGGRITVQMVSRLTGLDLNKQDNALIGTLCQPKMTITPHSINKAGSSEVVECEQLDRPNQRALTKGGRITVQMVSRLTGLDLNKQDNALVGTLCQHNMTITFH